MKLQKTKLGFTLIELMVVITIIGILATGAVSVYTTQIQKARDSNRITSLKAFQWGLEQAYSDASVYPDPVKTDTAATDALCSGDNPPIKCLVFLWYMPSLPKDVKSGQKWSSSWLDFTYSAITIDWVALQWFEASTWFEAKASVTSKAAHDNWSDDTRFETWNAISTAVTKLTNQSSVASCKWINTDWTAKTSWVTELIIKG